ARQLYITVQNHTWVNPLDPKITLIIIYLGDKIYKHIDAESQLPMQSSKTGDRTGNIKLILPPLHHRD
uniref:Uncharacterized protein n=1 Tax=Oryza brachyantha TaxID=4533 RepID=J3N814_ORYBR